MEDGAAADGEEETGTMSKTIDELILDGERRGEIRGEIRGEQRGKYLGEDRALALIRCLVQDDRMPLISRITEDSILREKLYRQYRV